MATHGLLEAINRIEGMFDPATGMVVVPDEFFTPGFWVVLTAFAWRRRIPPDHIQVSEKHRGYLSAVGFQRALGHPDNFQFDRKNEGTNYSTLAHLDMPESTDNATSTINSCIRKSLGRELPKEFVEMLCDVVGDLHANVWAHGKASGFSLAQKWRTPPWNPLSGDYCLEFALADSGIGFLREVQNAGLAITTDKEAIEWCIQEGHSTKKIRPVSEWAQRIPSDVIGNPLRGVEQARITDNHHMGLGLYKLVRLVQEFRGFLWLATGASVLELAPDCKPAYTDTRHSWQGVAIACRFRSKGIRSIRLDIERGDKDIEEIMRIIGGKHD